MKKLLHIILVIASLLAFKLNLSAQLTEENKEQRINISSPKSPTISELDKYIDYPVNNYTGIPQIEYPIAEFNCKGYSIPISLSYHGGGVKVDEYASWVGLGWSLNAGGYISRQINNQPDEMFDVGYWDAALDYAPNGFEQYYLNIADKKKDFQLVENGAKDFEPDVFTYNFMGKSGKFIINPYDNFNAINIPNSDLKIILDRQNLSFIIYDEFGNKYFFEKKNYTNTTTYDILNPTNKIPSIRNISTWLLTKIDLVNAIDDVYFEYIGDVEVTKSAVQQTRYVKHYFAAPDKETELLESLIQNESYKLLNIRFGDNNLSFKSEYREDYLNNTPITRKPLRLKEIIEETNGSSISIASFYHSYFCNSSNSKRLKLDSFKLKGRMYGCDYYKPNLLPDINSYSVDFWGYYNGRQNYSFIPSYEQNGNVHMYSDRKSSFEHTKIGSLTKITLPTGGFVNFNWEINDYTNVGNRIPIIDVNSNVVYSNKTLVRNKYRKKLFDLLSDQSILLDNIDLMAAQQVTIRIGTDVRDDYKSKIKFSLGSFSSDLNNNTEKVDLCIGNYDLRLIGDGTIYETDGDINIIVEYFVDNSPKFNFIGGGLRIESIDYYISEDEKPIRKKYCYHDDYGFSTGVLPCNFPNRKYDRLFLLKRSHDICPENYKYTVLTGSSQGFYGFASQANVGYRKVKVTYENLSHFKNCTDPIFNSIYQEVPTDKNGAQIYCYTSPFEYPTGFNNEYPFVPYFANNNDLSWRRGKLTNLISLNADNDTVSVDHNVYEKIEKHKIVCGISFGHFDYKVQFKSSDFGCFIGRTNKFYTQIYGFSTGNFRLKEKIQKFYSEKNVPPVTCQTVYSYNPYCNNIISSERKFCGSIQDLQSYSYSIDYLNNNSIETDNSVIWLMKSNNQIGNIVKIESKRFDYSQLVSSVDIHERINSSTYSEKEYVYIDTLDQIILKKEKQIFNNSESEKIANRFDSNLNIVEYVEKNSNTITKPKTIFIWGYNNTLPVAKIENASYQEVENILGKDIITELGLSNDDSYIKSKASLLRAALPNAQITTYTHKPLVGITSQTDPNGVTTYYKYDDFGRLLYVLDADKNIINSNSYQYHGQAVVEDSYNHSSITASAIGYGTISPSGIVKVPMGSSKTFTATPSSTTKVKRILLNGAVVVDNSATGGLNPKPFSNTESMLYTVNNISSDVTIIAEFEPRKYAVKVSNSGLTSESNVATFVSYADYGSSKTFTFTEKDGYEFIDVKINGISVGKKYSHVVPFVTQDINVVAVYKSIPIKGRVTSSTGIGVSGVKIEVISNEQGIGSNSEVVLETVYTDSNGFFVLGNYYNLNYNRINQPKYIQATLEGYVFDRVLLSGVTNIYGCGLNDLEVILPNLFIEGNNCSSTFDIITCTDWTVTQTSLGTWLTLDKTNGNGNSTITVNATAGCFRNRIATLEVKVGNATKLVTITQIADDGSLLEPDTRTKLR